MSGTPDAPCSGFMREMQVCGMCGDGHGRVWRCVGGAGVGGCGGVRTVTGGCGVVV